MIPKSISKAGRVAESKIWANRSPEAKSLFVDSEITAEIFAIDRGLRFRIAKNLIF